MQIKQQLLTALTNFGQPYIEVMDGNYSNRNELYLRHRHEGSDLKVDYAQATLENLNKIWKRPIHVETVVDERPKLFSFDGKEHTTKTL